MSGIVLLLTSKCNYQCRHCYLSCGPTGESLKLEQAKRIIDYLPQNINYLCLSGGEVFVTKRLLYDVLSYLSSRNFQKLKYPVDIYTNGFWGNTDESTKKIVCELLDLNLNFPIKLEMNFDLFHEEQGLKIAYLHRIIKTIENATMTENKLSATISNASNHWSDWAVPVGRAEIMVPRERWYKDGECSRYYKRGIHATIDSHGQVFKCCMIQHKPLGNVLETPLNKILKKEFSDPILKLLRENGIQAAAQQCGFSKEKITELIGEGGECYLCSKVFRTSV